MSWCTIESDPGVFTELIHQIGVKGVQVAEVYDLDQMSYDELKPVYGLIFLFKWEKNIETEDERPIVEDPDGVFFAHQVINNACGTQAILSVLMNSPEVELGPELTNLKEFTAALPPDDRGLAIGNSSRIREAHNSFARPEPFLSDEKAAHPEEDDELYHFVGYVPVNGILYELDGLKSGPIVLGDCDGAAWFDLAKTVIRERMNKYISKEIRCTLLAVVKDRSATYKEQLAELKTRRSALEQKLKTLQSSSGSGSATGECQASILALGHEEKMLKEKLEDEEHKQHQYKQENVRRKHNYVPFVYNLLKKLAEKNQLTALVEHAKKTEAEAIERLKKQKAASKAASKSGTAKK